MQHDFQKMSIVVMKEFNKKYLLLQKKINKFL